MKAVARALGLGTLVMLAACASESGQPAPNGVPAPKPIGTIVQADVTSDFGNAVNNSATAGAGLLALLGGCPICDAVVGGAAALNAIVGLLDPAPDLTAQVNALQNQVQQLNWEMVTVQNDIQTIDTQLAQLSAQLDQVAEWSGFNEVTSTRQQALEDAINFFVANSSLIGPTGGVPSQDFLAFQTQAIALEGAVRFFATMASEPYPITNPTLSAELRNFATVSLADALTMRAVYLKQAGINVVNSGMSNGAWFSKYVDMVSTNQPGTEGYLLQLFRDSLVDPYGPVRGAGDFNGDHIPNLVVEDPITNDVRIVLMGPNLQAKESITIGSLDPANGSAVVGVGDFNDDGWNDLLVTMNAGDPWHVWEMNGVEQVGDASISITCPGEESIAPFTEWPIFNFTPAAVGDFNGDHHPDIVTNTTYGASALGISEPLS